MKTTAELSIEFAEFMLSRSSFLRKMKAMNDIKGTPMNNDKMRAFEAYEKWSNSPEQAELDSADKDQHSFVNGYLSALSTHGQESEAHAEIRWCIGDKIYGRPTATDALEYVNLRLSNSEELECCGKDTRVKKMDNVKALLNPSALAIETAALRKAAEVCDEFSCGVTGADIAEHIRDTIPQDGITELERFGMRVAEAVRYRLGQSETIEMEDFQAIIASLIGEK